MKTLLIDNYDSFSQILFQYLWELNGERPIFIHNDDWTLERIRAERFDNILISPGPGHPGNRRDFGICGDVIRALPHIPMLGVCLGHQGLGLSAGARVVKAPAVRHGKPSGILHDGEGLFAGLPQGFQAIRYHSLVIEAEGLPDGISVTATAGDDGQIMAIRLRGRPAFGVQFHPESICTEGGKLLLRNFRDITARHVHGAGFKEAGATVPDVAAELPIAPLLPVPELEAVELPWIDPEAAFQSLFLPCPAAFWLDSRAEPVPGEPLFSYMGAGPRLIEIRDSEIRSLVLGPDGPGFEPEAILAGDPLERLKGYLGNTVTGRLPEFGPYRGSFRGGLVGYFGYGMGVFSLRSGPAGEIKAALARPAPASEMPDGLFLEPDRVLAFDHAARKAYAFLPRREGAPEAVARKWLESLPGLWNAIPAAPLDLVRAGSDAARAGDLKLPWRLSAGKEEYLARIRNLQASIVGGESYEACLTNEALVEADADPFLVYRLLRRTNPAPYAAYLSFPQGRILCASPERFLKLDRTGILSSRPIKGTRPRGGTAEEDGRLKADLAGDAKDRSENLMIVDLVRHDFGKVCSLGSVHVPELMAVESHPTVLQLVSSVEGRLASGMDALDAVRACFPGGSMTGAPKLRTMELLAAQEKRARGVFSGGLGYLGWDGSMNLGMVIRTLVHKDGVFRTGCGGAILAESDPEAEFAEAMLKAFAPLRAVELAVLGVCGGWSWKDLDRRDRHD